MSNHINLLPKSLLNRNLVTNRLKQWGLVIVCLWLGIFCVYRVQKSKYYAEQKEVEKLEALSLPIAQKKADILTAQQQINELIQRQHLGMGLEQGNVPLQVIGKVSQSAMASEGNLHIDLFELTPITTSASQVAAKQVAAKNKKEVSTIGLSEAVPSQHLNAKLFIDGQAWNDLTITQFILHLKSTGMFQNVELKSTEEKIRNEMRIRSFRIECLL